MFTFGIIVLVYTFVLYPMIVVIGARLSRGEPLNGVDAGGFSNETLPRVSVVIAMHNEEENVVERIVDCYAQGYPDALFEVVVASDGSTDGTVERAKELASEYPSLRILESPAHVGRSTLYNRVLDTIDSDIVVFSDAGSRFADGSLKRLVSYFRYPQVGCVGGRVKYINCCESTIARIEGLYRIFDYSIRAAESRLGMLFSASGACLAFRRTLFSDLPVQADVDPILGVRISRMGFRVVFADDVVVEDRIVSTYQRQFCSRIRISTQGLQGLLGELRAGGLRPGVVVAIVSRKILRWCSPAIGMVSLAGVYWGRTALLLLTCLYGLSYVVDMQPLSVIRVVVNTSIAFTIGLTRALLRMPVAKYDKNT